MVDWMHYSKIQEYKRKSFKKTQVARRLGINRETVSLYWDMSPSEYMLRVNSAKSITKKQMSIKSMLWNV